MTRRNPSRPNNLRILKETKQINRLIQQRVGPGTGQLLFSPESPHRAGTWDARAVGGQDIHIRISDVQGGFRLCSNRIQCRKQGGWIRFRAPARPPSADRGKRIFREKMTQDFNRLFLRLIGHDK